MKDSQLALEQYFTINKIYPCAEGGSDTLEGLVWIYGNTGQTGCSPDPFPFFRDSKAPRDPLDKVDGNENEYPSYRYWRCDDDSAANVAYFAKKYAICAKLEKCNGKCNKNTPATSSDLQLWKNDFSFGCGFTNETVTTTSGYYCLRSLSN